MSANWAETRVLVTGAGGFIGSHLTDRLVQLGARVRAFVRYRSNGSWGWLDHLPCKDALEVISGDLADRDGVLQAMQGMEIVFHLGAFIAIPYSYVAPSSFVTTNVLGALNVLQAAKTVGVRRVVHTSTSEVYGTAQYVPIDERHPLQAQSPYAASKIAADKLVESFHLSYDLPVVTVRPFNTYGPRQSARAIVPTIITQCLADTGVRLGNLRPTRDLNFVSDTVDGFIRAAVHPQAVGRTINLGSGRETSIAQLAELVARLIGKTVHVTQEVERVRPSGSEVERLVADNTAAKAVLGWQPTISLEEGLQQTIDWFRSHIDAYRCGVYVL